MTVVVVELDKSLTNKITVGRHELYGDEPTTVPGGKDIGPSPFDYLMTALGCCTSMTLRMYAGNKSWPLEGVKVTLTHEKTADRKDLFRRTVTLTGPLSDEQRARLLEIANKCPVHRALSGNSRIETALGTSS